MHNEKARREFQLIMKCRFCKDAEVDAIHFVDTRKFHVPLIYNGD